jgi:hypothetical protein
MIKIKNLKMPISYNDKDLYEKAAKKVGIPVEELQGLKIIKRSLDARKKSDLSFVFELNIVVKEEKKLLKRNKKLELANAYHYSYPKAHKTFKRPLILGFGPAGIFAAYVFVKAGIKPIVIEQGQEVDQRTKTVEEFWSKGILNTDSNVQFGEGGAGTFSDGKLTTRSKDPRSQKVLEILVEHGAPEEILYSHKPHVGTDLLKGIIKSMREEIIELGGEIMFSTKMIDLIIEGDAIKGVETNKGCFYSDHLILAIGNSGRDAYEILHRHKVTLEQKPFAMGVRIEHPQVMIDENQYGSLEAREYLGASDYKLTYKTSNGRSVYSFCVCPGGMVVASASEAGGIVVNGMSEYKRDQENINSALLVQVFPDDFESDHPLAGMYFQRKYEQMAYGLTKDYFGPSQNVESFLNNSANHISGVMPSYRPGVNMCDISQCLPDFITLSLKEALVSFGRKIKGFDRPDGILTAIESRSSAPVRIIRDFESLESISHRGLFPVGEGAGYAGGIVSSAIDGIKIAEKIIR